MKLDNIFLDNIINIAKSAGNKVLDIYNQENFDVKTKEDNSHLTEADQTSHQLIVEELSKLEKNIPIISEEGRDINFDERKNWNAFWLVDPLDGTKEFIKRNGEFTVNIGLIENNIPVLGVLHVPVSGETYYGQIGFGAWKVDKDKCKKIKVKNKNKTDELVVIQSRSHSGVEENFFYSNYRVKETISKGSSLKICLLAEGKADMYYRGGPTWEWDTAAGHAILTAAGGFIYKKNMKSFLNYNKIDLKNNGFIASAFELN